MDNKDVNSPMNAFKDLRRDDGMTMMSTLAGIMIAALVLGGLTLFWINSNKTAKDVTEVSAQEAAGLRVMNSAAKDIGQANPVVEASDKKIVIDVPKADGKDRITYALDKSNPEDIKFTRTVNDKAAKVVADKARDETVFTYFDRKGQRLDSPLTDADAKKVARVDVAFKADAGSGYVELKTKVSVRKGSSDGNESTAAACQITNLQAVVNSSNRPTLTWNGQPGAIVRYDIERNGTKIPGAEVAHTGTGEHTYTDTNPSMGANLYTVVPIAEGGKIIECAPVTATVTIDPPVVGGDLIGDDTMMRLQWSEVPGATSYEVTYQPVDPATDTVTGTPATVQVTGTSGTSPDGKFFWHTDDGYEVNATYVEFEPALGTQYRFSVKSVAKSGKSVKSNEFDLMNKPAVAGNPSLSLLDYSRHQVAFGKAAHEGFRVRTFRGATEAAAKSSTTPLPDYTDAKNGNAAVKMTWEYAPGASSTAIPIWSHNLVGGTAGAANPNQDYLGYWYSYEITKINRGPRLAMPGESLAQQTHTDMNGNATRTNETVLQYPADPVVDVRGTERAGVESNTGTADGKNQIVVTRDMGRANVPFYNIGKAYQPATAHIHQKGTAWLDEGWGRVEGNASSTDDCPDGAQFLCIHDGGQIEGKGPVQPGTRYFYRVWAQNATGNSPALSVGNTDTKVWQAAYQRPETPVLNQGLHQFWGAQGTTVDATIDPSDGKPVGNHFRLAWNLLVNPEGGWPLDAPDYPEQNQPADQKFCASDSSAECRYIVKRDNQDDGSAGWVKRSEVKAGTYDYVYKRFDDVVTDWGTRDIYAVQACNAGGCSTIKSGANTNVDSFPGPFTVDQDTTTTDLQEKIDEAYTIGYRGGSNPTLKWAEAATGSISNKTRITKTPEGKPVHMRIDQQKWVDAWGTFWEDNWETISNVSTSSTTRQFVAFPSTVNRWVHSAYSRWNPDLRRDVSYVRGTPPPKTHFSFNSALCYWNSNDTLNRTKYGSRIDMATGNYSPSLLPWGSGAQVNRTDVKWAAGQTGSSNQTTVRDAAVAAVGAKGVSFSRTHTKKADTGFWTYAVGTGSDSEKKWNGYQRFIRTNQDALKGAYIIWHYQSHITSYPAAAGTVNKSRTYSAASTHIDWRDSDGFGSTSYCMPSSTAANVIHETAGGAKYTEANAWGTVGADGTSSFQGVLYPNDGHLYSRSTGSGYSFVPPRGVNAGTNYIRANWGDAFMAPSNWYVNG